jgi:TRAP-type mannitol/chloroaromatic compound transport system permease small subunit
VTPARGSVPAERRVLLALDAVTRAMAYGSGALFLLVALYLAADAVSRKFFHVSTAVSDEFGGYVLAVGAMWALAYTLRTGAHVRIDILLPHLPARLQILLNYLALAGMAAFSALLARQTWGLALESLATDARAMSFLRTPLFPPQALMAIGLSLLCLEAVALFGVGLVESLRRGRLAPPSGFGASAEPSHAG